jgi:hypothetical protein
MPLDIAFGLFAAWLTSMTFEFPLTRQWALLGATFALLPDIDILYMIFALRGRQAGKVSAGHREWTHYPLLYPVPIAIAWWIWGREAAVLLGLGLYWHTVHDSFGTGFGVKWLAPLNWRNYKLFAREDGQVSWQTPVRSWDPEEYKELLRVHGNENWLRDTYLRPNRIFLIEVAGFLLALALLFWFLD